MQGVNYETAKGVHCLTCGAETVGVKAHAQGLDYCRGCFYAGVAEEHRQAKRVQLFRDAFPDGTVAIEHTGGGCFWLAVRFGDGADYYTATDDAGIPAAGEPWQVLCRNNDAEDSTDYYGTMIAGDSGVTAHDGPTGDLSDQQVIDAINADRA